MRLAYKELEIDRKMEEKKLRNLEGKKKEQAERLGMGLGARRYRTGAGPALLASEGDLQHHASASAPPPAPCLTR